MPVSYDARLEGVDGGFRVVCDGRTVGVVESVDGTYSVCWPSPDTLGLWPIPHGSEPVLFMYLLGYWEGREASGSSPISSRRRHVPAAMDMAKVEELAPLPGDDVDESPRPPIFLI